MSAFADIILPLAQQSYTFAANTIADLKVGDAVSVQFGKSAVYTGIVQRLHDNPPARGQAKPILKRLYNYPITNPTQLRFWEWMSTYYLSTIGEVMRMALPSLVKPHAANEQLFTPYALKQEKILRLIEGIEPQTIEALTARAPRRKALLEQLEQCGGVMPRSATTSDTPTINALVKGGVIEIIYQDISPQMQPIFTQELPTLSPEQSQALSDIDKALQARDVVLLHGVTSSGKTEIVAHRIAAALERGEDVLMLVPEISLTSQLVERMKRIFGQKVTAYHSKLTATRRTNIYMDMLRTESGHLIIGARSAIFLPYKHLGLVVVDEEHDSSYKQTEPNPRYHGRDAAIMLASLHKAKSILCSATPSIESFNNAMTGKYAGVWLPNRYGGSLPPKISLSDTLRAVKRGERVSHFNKDLTDRIAARLAAGEQVILFQNRRGYAPYVECPQCGWTARCPHCNVTLSKHLKSDSLRCHYCGYSIPDPHFCPDCKKSQLESRGFGTEKIEDEISTLFPTARVLRLDSDIASSQGAYDKIITDFAEHRADILVGTQIVAKGLDFADVTLIGILNADNLLNAPDFRAAERAWQTIMQVAGRCGRRDRAGEVIIQTSDTAHPLFSALSERGYRNFATVQLSERKLFNYPPFCRLIRISLRHQEAKRLAATASTLGGALRARSSGRILGPVTPLIDRIRGELIVEIMVKAEPQNFAIVRKRVMEIVSDIRKAKEHSGVAIICDVDPI